MRKILIPALLPLFIFSAISCQKDLKTDINSQGSLRLQFRPVVDAAMLDFSSNFQNAFGESYTIRSFKFYIHRIELITNSNNKYVLDDDYYLVDAANPASMMMTLQANAAKYKAIAFTIGVDSARNVSGAQSNALDPANGMFWTWNSGYIMAKFEGVSPVSTQPGNRFEFHIGGFKGADNVVKRIELPFSASALLEVQKDKTSIVDISANANAWFTGSHPLDIATSPVCMTPGALAKSFAENYYNMFAITSVENNQ